MDFKRDKDGNPIVPEELYSGPSVFQKIKRDWHICPRCQQRRVSRIMRMCLNCNGKLYFDGDTPPTKKDDILIQGDYFMWHKSVFGLEGWFHSSYWRDNHQEQKY